VTRPPTVIGGRRATLEAIRAGRALEVLVASGSRQTEALREVLEASNAAGVGVKEVPRRELDALGADHQGVAVSVRELVYLRERDLATYPFGDEDVVVVLDGITDPQNFGAAARSAEATGVTMLITRKRRAGGPTPAAVRASAGALLHLSHARVANIARAIERLKQVGFFVVGLDEKAEVSVYATPCPPGRVAIVLGSEGEGLSRLAREACDALVSLPMRGKVSSLNASAALAAVLYAYVVPSRGV
jgi:predicted rRNA methylase